MSQENNELENHPSNNATMQDQAAEHNPETPEVAVEENEVAKLTAELASQKDQLLRLFADFENYRRQSAKKQLELIQTANKELMTALLPVVDDFERAIKASEGDEKLLEGFSLIQNKLTKTLESKGLKRMASTIGKNFDVETMEAITKIPAPSPELKGTVYDEVESGFTLGEHIIRYAKVVIAE
jgi:molecular chaperone GrpE